MSQSQTTFLPRGGRGLLTRGVLMLVMALAFQLSASLLALVAIAQLILTFVDDAPNERLAQLGRTLGLYLRQIAEYETFARDEAPFPFSDWPSLR